MSFEKRLVEARKKKGFSQDELAKMMGTHGPAIGRYERGLAKPTIEVAGKLAKLLGVTLDYLVGNSDEELDELTKKRILEVQQLPQEERERILYFIDMAIRDYKAQKVYA